MKNTGSTQASPPDNIEALRIISEKQIVVGKQANNEST